MSSLIFVGKTNDFVLLIQGQTVLGESSSESEEDRKERDKTQGGKKTPPKSTKPVTPQKEEKVKSKKQGNLTSPSKKKEEKKHDKTEKADGKPKPKFHVNYEFFDPGNHWCRKCNVVTSNVYEVFQHLQKKQHISVSIFKFNKLMFVILIRPIFQDFKTMLEYEKDY